MKKINHPFVITVALVGAFLCGVYFERSQKNVALETIPTPRVYLEQLKTKMNIHREGAVEIYVNSTKINDDMTLDIK